MYSISNDSNLKEPFNSIIFKSLVMSIFFSLNFSMTNIAVNGVAKILHFNLGHKCAIAPI